MRVLAFVTGVVQALLICGLVIEWLNIVFVADHLTDIDRALVLFGTIAAVALYAKMHPDTPAAPGRKWETH